MEFNNKPYENCKMLSVNGDFLAYTDLKRMNWYLDRDLAIKLGDKSFQLNFITQGDGNAERSDYYKVPLENKCVVCGTDEELTKHHVVPSQYRKHLPVEYKGRNSYDVVSICDTCHNNYEREAEKVNAMLLDKYGLTDYVRETIMLRRCFNILKYHGEFYDGGELAEMEVDLEMYYEKPIDEILAMNQLEFDNVSTILMSKIEDGEAFVIMWREHFLEVAKPQHIHQKWVDNIKNV